MEMQAAHKGVTPDHGSQVEAKGGMGPSTPSKEAHLRGGPERSSHKIPVGTSGDRATPLGQSRGSTGHGDDDLEEVRRGWQDLFLPWA